MVRDYSRRASIIPRMADSQHIEVRVAANEDDWRAALAVRHEVFVVEQGVPPELERDDADSAAVHVVASCGGEIVGTARLTRGAEARIGRVAVLPAWRRRGIAGRLLAALESEARKLRLREISLHSQRSVQRLYARHGYETTGGPFIEAGIEHVPMAKRLV